MAEPGRKPAAGNTRSAAGEIIPPQEHVSGGGTPMELGGTGWRNTVKRAGKKFLESLQHDRREPGLPLVSWPYSRPDRLLGLASLAHLGTSTVQRLVHGMDTALPQIPMSRSGGAEFSADLEMG